LPQTTSTILASVITASLQQKTLEPLRAALVYANRAWAEQGTFQRGSDIIKFANVPDLAIVTTPLTEGVTPSAVQLSVGAVSVAADQYGNVVDISDLTKVKSPIDIINTGAERLARNAAESIDQLVRDVIALGGTPFYSDPTAGVRSDLTSADPMTAAALRRLNATMYKNKVPMPADGYYRIIVSPNVYFDLRNETAAGSWQDTLKYTDAEPLLAGEMGRLEGFRVMRAVNAPTFASTTTVHASIAFGALPGWGWGDLQSLKTYHEAPGGNSDVLQLSEKLGWKVDFGVGVLDNARYYRAESAATAL
jgi:N4-gp56 family major capsid protein